MTNVLKSLGLVVLGFILAVIGGLIGGSVGSYVGDNLLKYPHRTSDVFSAIFAAFFAGSLVIFKIDAKYAPQSGVRKLKLIIWLLAGLIVVCLLAYFFYIVPTVGCVEDCNFFP